jgi:hypothetical protein
MSYTVDSLTYTTRKKLTVDQTKIDTADLTDFPCLVKLTSTNFDFSKSNPDGFDIRFTAADGATLLKYERERHDSANSLAEYWVKIPTVYYDADTDFYIYYRTDDTVDGADPENVWDSNFKAVWTLKDATTSTILDSTANNKDGTKKGANTPIEVDGKIGKGQDFESSNSEYIDVSDPLDLTTGTEATFEAWVNPENLSAEQKLFWHGKGTMQLFISGGDGLTKMHAGIRTSTPSWVGINGGTTMSVGNWYHLAVTWKKNDYLKIYLNGASDASPVSSGNYYLYDYSGTLPTKIGALGNNTSCLDGILDDLRISNVVRPAQWIKATYNSGNDSLLTYGAEEGGGVVTSIKDIIGGFGIIPFNR